MSCCTLAGALSLYVLHFISNMAKTRLSAPAGFTSGADSSFLDDANALTLCGMGLAAVTAGGALFIGAAVAPTQVVGGLVAAGTLAAGGEVKNRTGSYLPFFKKDAEAAPTPETVTATA